jgi:glycosyltransferase involved in cell wall biosynthesis
MKKNNPFYSGLVSIIIPCYNVKLLLPKLLESVLHQTYKNLEVILVNDGSSDNTWEIICNYAPRLEAEGYSVKTVNQKNGGQSSAIDSGLKLFTGEFLTWPDSDDWLTPDSIEKRVEIFHKYHDIALVRCNAEQIDSDTGESLGFFEAKTSIEYVRKNLFTELLHLKTYFAPVCYMVRTTAFLNVNPARSIYINRLAGQNLQMLLPITSCNKSMQMGEVLAYYLVRNGSHSRSNKTYEDLYRTEKLMWQVTYETLLRMSNADDALLQDTARYYARNKLLTAAFRARLKKESINHLNQSGIGPTRQRICKAIIALHFLEVSKMLDFLTFRYFSKLLGRCFYLTVLR